MKKNLFLSYFSGIKDREHGQGFLKIFQYFIPELVTAIILYSGPLLIDAQWVAQLHSTAAYATLGITNTILHSIIKIAEGLSVGTIIATGQFNGVGNYKRAGEGLVHAFWTTIVVGIFVAIGLYLGAGRIYTYYRLPVAMISMGVPFMKVRAVGIFFAFVYFALIGFLRGVKNSQTPMHIFMLGCAVFLFFDYALIFGSFGFPAMGLMGSAVASVIQYAVMCGICLWFVARQTSFKIYEINFSPFSLYWGRIKELCLLSLPIIIDKAALSLAYVWLGYCMAPMGTCALASFSVVKDLERFALLPAIAFAQVITFLVSNDFGKKDWEGIKSTIKKIVLMSSVSVFIILFVCSMWPSSIIQMFDFKGEFTDFAAKAFPVISALAFFDVLQLILSGALRGAGDVRVVMWTRLVSCVLFFAPLAYLFSRITTDRMVFKFVLIYGTLYLCNAVMSFSYVKRFRRDLWKRKVLEGVE